MRGMRFVSFITAPQYNGAFPEIVIDVAFSVNGLDDFQFLHEHFCFLDPDSSFPP